MSRYYILGLLVLLAPLWVGCAQPEPTITPTSRATPTPTPTLPGMTITPEATATLAPESTPTPTAPPISSRVPFKVIASGLDNPRGLAFGPEGALYVTEAGRGGNEFCIEGPGGSIHCYGLTGAVTRVWQDVQERIAIGLPSLSSREGAVTYGPHDISFNEKGDGYLIIGFAAHPDVRKQLGEGGAAFGRLLHISAEGKLRNIGDPAAHEALANPDGAHIESNPYALLALPDEYIIVDAAGNSLLRMDADGNVATLAAFPTRSVEAPASFNLPSGTKFPIQSVPTAVTLGPDGAYYVSELTGGPYPPGEARIYRIVPGQEPQVFAEGFTNVIDIAFNGDGSLLVLEIATNSLASPDPVGALIRLNPKTGKREIVAREGLQMPAGFAIGPDGAVYISNCGVCVGEGQVIRIDLTDS